MTEWVRRAKDRKPKAVIQAREALVKRGKIASSEALFPATGQLLMKGKAADGEGRESKERPISLGGRPGRSGHDVVRDHRLALAVLHPDGEFGRAGTPDGDHGGIKKFILGVTANGRKFVE